MPKDKEPIACSLGPAEAESQVAEWSTLQGACQRATVKDGAAQLWFPTDLASTLRVLTTREQECCPFLSLRVVEGGEFVRLDIATDDAQAWPVVALLANAASGQA
jgi:hypothetical protein